MTILSHENKVVELPRRLKAVHMRPALDDVSDDDFRLLVMPKPKPVETNEQPEPPEAA